MPAVVPEELVSAITNAITDSGYVGQIASPIRRHPRVFVVSGQNAPSVLTVYAWTLTFGGRPSLKNEYRIQMTSVRSPLASGTDGPTLLLGYEPRLNLFAGFDIKRHRDFTAGSPSVQVDIEALQQAEIEGLSFHRKNNEEIVVGIRPDMFIAYAMNAEILHRYGRDAGVLRLLKEAVHREPAKEDLEALPPERKRVVTEVSRLARDAGFRRKVLFAYGNRCAVTRVQLRLVDAAHILPVGAPGSNDQVRNGIALSPTYHRAFDAGLIFLDEQCRMQLNNGQLHLLAQMKLEGGADYLREPLGQIFLPPDPKQRPSSDFIRRANQFRQITT